MRNTPKPEFEWQKQGLLGIWASLFQYRGDEKLC